MNNKIEVPAALTAQGDGALARAVAWCRQHLGPGERVALWVALKKNLRGNAEMTEFVERSGIEVITGRGLQTQTRPGPLIMLAPRVESIDEQMEYSRQMTALFVIGWGPEEHRAWAERAGAEIVPPAPWDA